MHTSGFSGALPSSDDARSTTTTPPTTQRKLKPDADSRRCSNPRHEPQNVSQKPKHDGVTRDRIVSRWENQGGRDPTH